MTAEGVPAARRRPNREAEYFCKLGWTWFLVICPSGKSPSSFRGARSANPESITTDACCNGIVAPALRNINVRGYGFRARAKRRIPE